MNAEQHVPQFRFKGFSDSWEQHKLSDGTNKIGDGLHGTPKYSEDGDVYFVNGNNLVNGQIVITSETKRVTSNEQSKDDKALNENTILMSINGTIGNLAWYRGENLMLGKSAAYIEVSDFDKKFIYTYLQTRPVKDYYLNSLTGTTIKNLGLKAIRNTNIYTPTIDEQAKIGVLFQNLDMTITLHQRKLAKLKELKKGYLQKLFPQNSEKVPEFRFKGYSDAWEKRKLREITEINPKGKIPEVFRYVDLESVKNSSIISSKIETKQTAPSRAQRTAEIGDVFYQTVRPYQKNNVIFLLHSSMPYVFSTGYAQLRSNMNSFFILYLVQTDGFVNDVLNRATGTSYPAINPTHLATINVCFPKIVSEQNRIGQVLEHLDNLITATQCKLDLLKKLKKGYLQKMFC